MIKIHHLKAAFQFFQQNKIPFRLLQDQAVVVMGFCNNAPKPTTNQPMDISENEIHWLMQQAEATQDYDNVLGGYVYVCETEADLLEIISYDLQWADSHAHRWPNVTDKPLPWDVCEYLQEKDDSAQWVIFQYCWNNAGGSIYYVPKHLWEQARVTEHIEATSPLSN